MRFCRKNDTLGSESTLETTSDAHEDVGEGAAERIEKSRQQHPSRAADAAADERDRGDVRGERARADRGQDPEPERGAEGREQTGHDFAPAR